MEELVYLEEHCQGGGSVVVTGAFSSTVALSPSSLTWSQLSTPASAQSFSTSSLSAGGQRSVHFVRV